MDRPLAEAVMRRTLAIVSVSVVLLVLLLVGMAGLGQEPPAPPPAAPAVDPETAAILQLVQQLQDARQVGGTGGSASTGVVGIVTAFGGLLALLGSHRAGWITVGGSGNKELNKELNDKLDDISKALGTVQATLQTQAAVTELRLTNAETEISDLRPVKHSIASLAEYKAEVNAVSAQYEAHEGRLADLDRRLQRVEGGR